MEPYYVWKHLGDGVEALLTRNGSLLERLEAAFMQSSLLFLGDDLSGAEPRALEHLKRLRDATVSDPTGPETGQLRWRLELLDVADRESLARDFLRAYVYQFPVSGAERP